MDMQTTRVCTKKSGGKHAWSFVRNITSGSVRLGVGGSSGRISARGLYRCTCGEVKAGATQVGGGDPLRKVIQALGGS